MKGKPEASLVSVVMQFGESILNNCHSEARVYGRRICFFLPNSGFLAR
jgi:hypothetical protein